MRLQHAVHIDRTVNAQYCQKVFMCLQFYKVKVSHSLISVGAVKVRVPLYLGHS